MKFSLPENKIASVSVCPPKTTKKTVLCFSIWQRTIFVKNLRFYV